MTVKVVSKEPFILKNCLNRYKTQEMYDKTIDAFLPTLKFVPDWIVTNKILEKLGNVLSFGDDIDLDDIDSDIDTFFSDDMVIILMKMILNLLFMLDIWLGVIDSNNVKHVKEIDKELIPIASYPARVWDWCMTKDENLWNDKSNA